MDISPRLRTPDAQIFSKLTTLPGVTALNIDALFSLVSAQAPGDGVRYGNMTPPTYPDGYITTVYPTPDVQATVLTATEWLNFYRFVYGDFFTRFQQRDISPFDTKVPALALSAVDAKYELTGTIGPVQNGTIVPACIRAVTAYPSMSSNIQNWIVSSVTAGWTTGTSGSQNGAFYIQLNTSTSGSIVRSPQNRVVMLVLGLGDFQSTPRIQEFQCLDSTGRKLGVHALPFIHSVNNLNIHEFDTAFLVQKNKLLSIDINFDTTGQDTPEVLGAQWQTIDYASTENS